MSTFAGFPSGKVRFTQVPSLFFSELMPHITHLGELKVVLYAFWFLDQKEGNTRYILFRDFLNDTVFMDNLEAATVSCLAEALDRAVQDGILLKAALEDQTSIEDAIFFLNSPRGKAALRGLEQGIWKPDLQQREPIVLKAERPNIFRLYEENIGPLTPMIAEDLREAEKIYPSEWVEEAIHTAIQNNVRRWKYVEAILRSWKEEGRNDSNRGDTTQDRHRYIKGELSDFVQH
jgi:DNA replication protein